MPLDQVLLRVAPWAVPPPGVLVLGPELLQVLHFPADNLEVWRFDSGAPRLHLRVLYDDTGERLSDLDRRHLRRGAW